MIYFNRVPSEMQTHGFTRYEVYDNTHFIGEVFQFRADVDARDVRWLAQRPGGTISGWLTALWTRKAAAAVLSSMARGEV